MFHHAVFKFILKYLAVSTRSSAQITFMWRGCIQPGNHGDAWILGMGSGFRMIELRLNEETTIKLVIRILLCEFDRHAA